MNKIFLRLTILFPFGLAFQTLLAQYPHHALPQYPEEWTAQWITHPNIDETAYNLIHFRNAFELESAPEQFIVHVSGDNRYRLYVNGQEVVYGPQLGDMRHWRYETVDLSFYLKKGKNIIAAEVINWGVERSYGIMSFRTAFLLQGHSEREIAINTTTNNWKVLTNQGMHEKTVFWRGGGEIIGGFYAANPTNSVVAAQYPWGWQQADFNDSQWLRPKMVFARPTTDASNGHGWILQPRTTVIQTSEKESLTRIARSDLANLPTDFQFGAQALEIPANSRHTLLIDQGYVTLGYPKLTLSGGKGAQVKVRYSEALYNDQNQKGNRNEIEGKVIKGISDVYVMDDGKNRTFQPIWFRAFRFIQLEVQTQDEPLQINGFYNVYSASPIPLQAEFATTDSVYQKVWDICWHGLKICAQDNLLSDAYYEQMQYVGDLRPHLMGWTALTGDLTYFRSAMEQFNNSRLPDGNVTSCYPLKATFVHPTYSLVWIDMLHDLMMLDGDKRLIQSYTGEIQEVFDYYESLINENGLVGKSKYPMFIDWYLPKGGNSPVNKDGNSAILTLNYAYTLGKTAKIMEWLGYQEKANFYQIQGAKYAEVVRRLCFDAERGIYADDPEKTFYDQRASILAVLTGAHTGEEKKSLMQKLLDSSTEFDSRANLFYYFYLFEAMQKTGVGDFTTELQLWKDIAAMGMSATPEKRIEQHPRSEVHPWTAHPVHFYFSLVAGIRPMSPGFKEVHIAPQPGSLETVQATYPTKQGTIHVDLQFKEEDVVGSIVLPPGMNGMFTWQKQQI
ncbi:MAG: family 78 glycoside hydrolase catalytic domain [Tunicatimonas sp.]|uniref:family 78 glycoside hydrolase catalytic domain n=1 Tax=Tunicatimonas sp. TaxID=1940096 RepID=UPI003C7916F9